MDDVKINPMLLEIISKIAENRQIDENDIINDFILKGIIDIGEEEEKEIYKDGIPIEIVAAEFGQTKEELIEELEEAKRSIDAGEGIALDLDDLEKRYKL